MTDEETPTHEAPKHRRKLPSWAPTVAALLLILAAAVTYTIGNFHESTRADTAEVHADSEQAKKDQLVNAADPICNRPQKDEQLTRLCAAAEQAQQPGPVPAERVDYVRVQALVGQALNDDPRLSEAALLGMVQNVYRSNPPKDGKAPTTEELLALVRQVYAADPPAPGPPGATGETGQKGDTGDQGATGDQGVQGVGTVDIRPERNSDGACEWVIVFEDPATGEQREVRHPAGDSACPAPPPPPETGGGILPGG